MSFVIYPQIMHVVITLCLIKCYPQMTGVFYKQSSAVTDIKDGTNMLYQNVSNKLSYTLRTAHKTKDINDSVKSLKSCN